jgi:hypothetical protein
MTTATYHVDLDPSWSVGDKPHGGYLLRTMLGCTLDDAHPHPMAVSAHYVSSPDAGAAQVQVERVRTGRRVAASRLRLVQEGAPRVEVLLTAGTLSSAEDFWSGPGGPPPLPPLEECRRMSTTGPSGRRAGYFDHVDLRVDAATAGWMQGRPHSRAEVRGWMRRDDGGDASPVDLVVFADSMPPVTFDLGLYGWVPTVELTVLVRGLAAPGWLRVVHRAQLLRDGWLDEDCTIWDSTGRLVVQARQLAGYRAE